MSGTAGTGRFGGGARQRGGAYVLVLITCAIVTAMALSSLAVRGAQYRSARTSSEIVAANQLARSGLELALQMMNTNPAWRSAIASGEWLPEWEVGGGKLALRVTDPADGNLADSALEPAVIRSVGVVGSARQIVETTVTVAEVPLTCLEVAAWARDGVTFEGLLLVTVTNDQIISTNGDAYNNGAKVSGRVEAKSFSEGGLLPLWTKQALTVGRDQPGADVFDPYVMAGTTIPHASLGSEGSKLVLQNIVLSPTSAPAGVSPNGRGIYVIDCAGKAIVVRNCRVRGTLVLLNLPSSGSVVDGNVAFDQAIPGYPVLMCQGNMAFSFNGGSLLDMLLGGGTSRIRGIVYVSGNATVPSSAPVFEGSLVVGGRLTISTSATFRYVNLAEPAAPGFRKPAPTNQMRPVAGSFRRVLE